MVSSFHVHACSRPARIARTRSSTPAPSFPTPRMQYFECRTGFLRDSTRLACRLAVELEVTVHRGHDHDDAPPQHAAGERVDPVQSSRGSGRCRPMPNHQRASTQQQKCCEENLEDVSTARRR